MSLFRILFVIISSLIANPVPVYRYLEDTIFYSSLDQGLSTFGTQYVDQNFEEVSSIIFSPLLEFDASETQPLGFTALDIVQNSPSPPKQSSDESYIKSEAQFYQIFDVATRKASAALMETLHFGLNWSGNVQHEYRSFSSVFVSLTWLILCMLEPSICLDAIYYPNCDQVWNLQIEVRNTSSTLIENGQFHFVPSIVTE